MLNSKETYDILNKFFKECLCYWESKGNTDRTPLENALEDVKRRKLSPYPPTMGDLLDEETKNKFIHYKETNLRR